MNTGGEKFCPVIGTSDGHLVSAGCLVTLGAWQIAEHSRDRLVVFAQGIPPSAEGQGTPRGDDAPPLRITRAGLQAIGVETEGGAPEGPMSADTAATPADAKSAAHTPARATKADVAPTPTRSTAKAKTANRGKTAQADKPTLRAGTKQAQMIEMLRRPAGATVEQIAAATGWQHHTIRGAISGALKKKLGLTVEVTRTREVSPNKTGAKGSTTVYRIVA
jgi:hypothetical protein